MEDATTYDRQPPPNRRHHRRSLAPDPFRVQVPTAKSLRSLHCTTTVSPATLWGRIKEDRNNQPDVTHDQESVTFTNDRSETVSTTTCQDDDTIYIESQINSEPANQSSGRTMNC
ncbi:hypothetical protein ABNF97_27505, partial [Plantactinospora sp. B6F1]|uniref:hypothetical protein n=1 Tax=Plantactinospora sp. B6F1 TaxID=3158971 RepID=UPI0032D8BB03